MKYKIGDRVKSTEVSELSYENTFQDKQLEIIEFLESGKVRCKFFLEKEVRPQIEYFEVSEESLTFISKEPLKYKDLGEDPFFNKHYKNRKV